MEDRETPRVHKHGESKTTLIMMETVHHVTSSSGLRKFQADGLLFGWVYKFVYIYIYIYIYICVCVCVRVYVCVNVYVCWGLDSRRIEYQKGDILRTRLYQPWVPAQCVPSLFSGCKAAGAWPSPPTSSDAEIKVRVELHVLFVDVNTYLNTD